MISLGSSQYTVLTAPLYAMLKYVQRSSACMITMPKDLDASMKPGELLDTVLTVILYGML